MESGKSKKCPLYPLYNHECRKDGVRGADVILAKSNSYKATTDAVKGLRPE